jgi:hypothetical protein
MNERPQSFYPLSRKRERVDRALRRETGEGGRRWKTFTLPSLCDGPLPLPQAGVG